MPLKWLMKTSQIILIEINAPSCFAIRHELGGVRNAAEEEPVYEKKSVGCRIARFDLWQQETGSPVADQLTINYYLIKVTP